MKCLYEGCNKELPEPTGRGGKQKYCPRHAIKVTEANVKTAQAKYLAKKKLEKAGKVVPQTKLCERCEKVEVSLHGKYCADCRKVVSRERKAKYAAKLRKEVITGPIHIGFKKECKRVVLTEEQRVKIDADKRLQDLELDRRLAAKCGYGHGEVKVLSAAEIAAIVHQLTPPQNGKVIIPWE